MKISKGVSVVGAGLGINLVIGVLYAWSIFKDAITASIGIGGDEALNWSASSVNDPYALCCLVFAFTMIPAGRVQDLMGPRKSALIGGVLGGVGFFLISNSLDYWVWMFGFGGLVGAGIGFAYAATTPAALRWFAPNKSNLVTAVVVSGFALASLYIAPLASYLVNSIGLQKSMLFFSVEFFLIITVLSLFLILPPEGYKPTGQQERRSAENEKSRHAFAHLDEEVASSLFALKDSRFWILWVLLFIGAGAGLMVIGNIKPLAKLSMGELAYFAIAILAVGDASGRILAGTLSTRFGRRNVLSAAFMLQTVLMFSAFYASQSGSAIYIVIVATLIGVNYGANLVIFPSYVKDFWGMRHFGVIYGMLFSAWGIGGFMMIKVAEYLSYKNQSSFMSFMLAGSLIGLGLLLTFFVDNRKDIERAALRKAFQQHH